MFIKYVDRYQASNILFMTEGQYHLEDTNEVNCLKMPSIWEFHDSYETDNTINTMFYSLLNCLHHFPNMGC